MSSDETNAYLQAKLQQAQGQPSNEKQAPSSKARGPKAKIQSEEQLVDMQAIRQMIEDVVRAQFEQFQATQSAQQDAPVIDMQAVQQMVVSVVRTELQTIQTTLTLLAHAVQEQAEAVMYDETEDEPLPTAPTRHTDEDEDREDEQVYPPFEESEDLDEEDQPIEMEDHFTDSLPHPEPPTHKLKHPAGPIALLLGDGIRLPIEGKRRWEPLYEQ